MGRSLRVLGFPGESGAQVHPGDWLWMVRSPLPRKAEAHGQKQMGCLRPLPRTGVRLEECREDWGDRCGKQTGQLRK